MPTVIPVGGGAAAFGSGLGQGVNIGIKESKAAAAKKEEEEKILAVAQEQNQVTSQAWRSAVAQQESESGFTPGRETFIDGGPSTPSWLDPGMDPDEAEFDQLVELHDTAIEGITDPKNRLAYLSVAQGDLTHLRGKLDKRRLEGQMASSLEAGHLTQQQYEELNNALLSKDANPTQIRAEFNDLVDMKAKQAARGSVVMQSFEMAQSGLAEVQQRFQSATTPEDKAHWQNVQGELSMFMAEEKLRMEMDPMGYDPVGALQTFNNIKTQPTTEQKARFEGSMKKQEMILKQTHAIELETVEARNRAIVKAIGEHVGEDEMKKILTSIGAGPASAPETIDPGVTGDPLGDLAKGVNSGALSGDAARAGLTDALEAMGWEPGTSVKDWVLGQPPEVQGKFKWLHERMSAEVADPLQSAALQPHPEAPKDGSKPLTQWVH